MSKMTPSAVGERAEIKVAAALAGSGKRVYIPVSASSRVDLVYEDGDGFHRVQCKAATVVNDVVVFRTSSNTGNVARDYRGEVDFFGVYCADRMEVYLVPVDDVPRTRGFLRLAPTRNGQVKGVRWAADYLLAEDDVPGTRRPEPRRAGPSA